jgi:hypothetical protein
LRAFMGFESGFVDTTNIQMPTVHIVFRNSGQTPAYGVRAGAGGGFGRYPLDAPVPPPLMLPNVTVVGPNDRIERHFRMAGPMPPEFVQQLTSSDHVAIWAVGRVEYNDTFRKKRFTNFRMFRRGPLAPSRKYPLIPDAEGNETDDDP